MLKYKQMASSIEDCENYLKSLLANYKAFTVVTQDDLYQLCWNAVWPIIEKNAGDINFDCQTNYEFNFQVSQIVNDYLVQQQAYDNRDRYATRKAYPEFIYESFDVKRSPEGIIAHFTYRLGEYTFTPEVTILANDIVDIKEKPINNSFLQYLFFNFGIINAINYYKLSCAPKFIIRCGKLDQKQKDFFKKLFYHGLGEMMYVNELNISYEDFMEIEAPEPERHYRFDLPEEFTGNLIPVGGGKDSVVTLEALHPMQEGALCMLYNRDIYPTNEAALDCIKLAGYSMDETVNFNLTIDKTMLELNKQGFYNGHIPFSSCLAFASVIMAYVNHKAYIVLSNEASANEGNLPNSTINHQYSKSFEFEKDFNNYVQDYFTEKIHYFSLLRCLNEYRIVQRFLATPLYLECFRSCNVGTKTNSWCGHCAKCLYVYIMLYPFVSEKKLGKIFGRNMLDDMELVQTFTGLVHPETLKPFECVGTKEEIVYSIEKGIERKPDYIPQLYQYYLNYLRVNINNVGEIEKYFNPEHNIPPEYLELITAEPKIDHENDDSEDIRLS